MTTPKAHPTSPTRNRKGSLAGSIMGRSRDVHLKRSASFDTSNSPENAKSVLEAVYDPRAYSVPNYSKLQPEAVIHSAPDSFSPDADAKLEKRPYKPKRELQKPRTPGTPKMSARRPFYDQLGITRTTLPTPTQIEVLLKDMRKPKMGVRLQFFEGVFAFTGRDVLSWITRYMHYRNRKDGIRVCQHLLETKKILQVGSAGAGSFIDKNKYKFSPDEFDDYLASLSFEQYSYLFSLLQSSLGIQYQVDSDGKRVISGSDRISWVVKRIRTIKDRSEAERLCQELVKRKYLLCSNNGQTSDKPAYLQYYFNDSTPTVPVYEIPSELCGACKKFTQVMYNDMPVWLACGHKFHAECLRDVGDTMGACMSCFETTQLRLTHSDEDLILPFIAKVLRSDAYVYRKRIVQFVDQFNKRYSGVRRSGSLKAAKAEILQFTNMINKSLLDNLKLLAIQQQGAQKCMTEVKQAILPRIYKVLFNLYKLSVYAKDTELCKKLKIMGTRTLGELHIKEKFWLTPKNHKTKVRARLNESAEPNDKEEEFLPYRLAIEYFRRLVNFQKVKDKLNCLILTRHFMHDAIVLHYKQEFPDKDLEQLDIALDADEEIMIWCWTIIKSGVKSLEAELRYISDWIDEHLTSGEAGYSLCTMETAVRHLSLQKLKKKGGKEIYERLEDLLKTV